MDIALLIARLLLAAVFIIAGLAKLVDLAGSRQALVDFGVPPRLVAPFGLLLPLGELIVALALIPRTTAWWGALGAGALLILFLAGIAINLARGNAPDCHCFGQLHSSPAGWPTLFRNGALVLLAGFVIRQGRTDAGLGAVSWLGRLSAVEQWLLFVATVALVGVVVEAWLVVHLLQQNGRVLLRLDILDGSLPAGQRVPGGAAQPAETGLPVGSSAPSFSLPGLQGEPVTLTRLCASGKRVLLIFSDPTCRPCNALLPEIGSWGREHSDLTVALISCGTREANLAKASEHGVSQVLLQQGNEVADAFEAQGTPSAVLIQSDGLVASPLAAGSGAIRRLVALSAEMPRISRRPTPIENRDQFAVRDVGLVPAPLRKSLLGTPAPLFRLPNVNGDLVDLIDFRGQDVILIFWSPGCSFCQRMLADLKSWESASSADALQLVIVSEGVAVNAALGLRSPIVLDEGATTGQAFGAHGTPAAIKIDADGKVASHVAVGALAIWSLAGSRPQTSPLMADGAPGADFESRLPVTQPSDDTSHVHLHTSKYHFAP